MTDRPMGDVTLARLRRCIAEDPSLRSLNLVRVKIRALLARHDAQAERIRELEAERDQLRADVVRSAERVEQLESALSDMLSVFRGDREMRIAAHRIESARSVLEGGDHA